MSKYYWGKFQRYNGKTQLIYLDKKITRDEMVEDYEEFRHNRADNLENKTAISVEDYKKLKEIADEDDES